LVKIKAQNATGKPPRWFLCLHPFCFRSAVRAARNKILSLSLSTVVQLCFFSTARFFIFSARRWRAEADFYEILCVCFLKAFWRTLKNYVLAGSESKIGPCQVFRFGNAKKWRSRRKDEGNMHDKQFVPWLMYYRSVSTFASVGFFASANSYVIFLIHLCLCWDGFLESWPLFLLQCHYQIPSNWLRMSSDNFVFFLIVNIWFRQW
jgi:hypothetical protein